MIDIQKTARVIEALIFASPAPVPRRALLPYLENEGQITEVLARGGGVRVRPLKKKDFFFICGRGKKSS